MTWQPSLAANRQGRRLYVRSVRLRWLQSKQRRWLEGLNRRVEGMGVHLLSHLNRMSLQLPTTFRQFSHLRITMKHHW